MALAGRGRTAVAVGEAKWAERIDGRPIRRQLERRVVAELTVERRESGLVQAARPAPGEGIVGRRVDLPGDPESPRALGEHVGQPLDGSAVDELEPRIDDSSRPGVEPQQIAAFGHRLPRDRRAAAPLPPEDRSAQASWPRVESGGASLAVMDRMQRLSKDVARQRADRAAATLAADPRVDLVFLFGSAADGAGAPRDVDLAILTEPALSLDELLRLRSDVVAEAGGEVDLVSLNHAPVVLAFEVADTGKCLYASAPELATEFVCNARMRYWDFKPFLEAQWSLARQRAEARRHGAPA